MADAHVLCALCPPPPLCPPCRDATTPLELENADFHSEVRLLAKRDAWNLANAGGSVLTAVATVQTKLPAVPDAP